MEYLDTCDSISDIPFANLVGTSFAELIENSFPELIERHVSELTEHHQSEVNRLNRIIERLDSEIEEKNKTINGLLFGESKDDFQSAG